MAVAIPFASPIDLNRNQILNSLAHVLSSAPGTPSIGLHYFDSTLNGPRWYDGTAFTNRATDSLLLQGQNSAYHLSRANHSGTQLASTISDFNTAVQLNRLDQLANPTASVNLNSQQIINLADGTSSSHAVNLGQLQAYVLGQDLKESVKFTTTGNISLSGLGTQAGGDWGSSLTSGDRILVKNQSTAAENGIYVAASGAWTRSTDCNSSANYTSQAFVMIESSASTLAATQWKVTTTGTITVGTTAVTWAQWGQGQAYTDGDGLSLTGNVFAVDLVSGGGLSFSGGQLQVNTSLVARRVTADIGNGSATTIDVTHNLGTRDITCTVYRNGTPWDTVFVRQERPDTNTVRLIFAVAPTSNEFRVVVH